MTLDVGRPSFPSRSHSSASYHEQLQRPPSEPPPIPPLPPEYQFQHQNMYRSQSAAPVFSHPPQQYAREFHPEMPHLGGEPFGVSQYSTVRLVSPAPPPMSQGPFPYQQKIQQGQGQGQGQMISHVPSFDPISFRGRTPVRSLPQPPAGPPPPPLPAGPPWNAQVPADVRSVTSLMASASLHGPQMSRIQSMHGSMEYSRHPLPPPVTPPVASPHLAVPLPSVESLQNALPFIQSVDADDSSRISWIRDALLLARRADANVGDYVSSSALPLVSDALPPGPIRISDPVLRSLAESAVALLISVMPTVPDRNQEIPPPLSEALYIRATLTASGLFPQFIAASPKNAFREFERAARAGFSHAWFRLGRDYEVVNDIPRARQCFEKGMAENDCGCIYRLGMASLLGQLDFPADSAEGKERSAQLLHRAAKLATVDFPHPPYVFALFLLGEFENAAIPLNILAAYVPPGHDTMQEARLHLERAAFLHFAPAQQRIGRAYEFAEPPFPFDPMLSVEYYSLASAGGDAQADLALSKWYLCGAEGYFAKDEILAREHAARAAARGLPAAMFAMGYCCEVGIGGPGDIDRARQWYEDAAALGDSDAQGRLSALADTSTPLSREQHDNLAETRLVRSRTLARMRSNAIASERVPSDQSGGPQQHNGTFQRRQASLPAHSPASDQYGGPVPFSQRRALPHHSVTLPPPRTSSRQESTGHSASTQQRFADRPRYSLVDPGVANSSGANSSGATSAPPSFRGLGHSTSMGAPFQSVARQNTGTSSNSNLRTPQGSPRTSDLALPSDAASETLSTSTSGTRYNTFAEMGIQGGRAEKEDCVIM